MDETKKIQDAVIEKADDMEEGPVEEKEEDVESEERIYKNKRADFYIELGLILILGILVGIAVKTEADKKITIGFSDYLIKQVPNAYNINQMEAQLVQEQSQTQSQAQNVENSSSISVSSGQSQSSQSQSQSSSVNSNQ